MDLRKIEIVCRFPPQIYRGITIVNLAITGFYVVSSAINLFQPCFEKKKTSHFLKEKSPWYLRGKNGEFFSVTYCETAPYL